VKRGELERRLKALGWGTKRIAAELRQQRMDLGAMMGLVIEEVRQDHRERILAGDAGIVDVAHRAAFEALRQI